MATRQKQHNGFSRNVAILGGGNIGQAIAAGLISSGKYRPAQVFLTRRQVAVLDDFRKRGFPVTSDNAAAVAACKIIIIAVQPGQLSAVLNSIRPEIQPRKHLILSAVTGVSITTISQELGGNTPVIRVMPNTAVSIGQSMTCLAANGRRGAALKAATRLFNTVGRTMVIDEEHMTAATALCACGIAFFLRSIRASSQGGIQIGFNAEEALKMAAQTARGAASLLLESNKHPESEIDRVTTPLGCTIAGLNRMEQAGFSSAMIQGLVTAAEIAKSLVPK